MVESFRHKLIFGLWIGLGLFPLVTRAQEQLADLAARIKPSVVTVVTFDKYGRKSGRGSGFCVATNQIVTNKHVIEGSFRTEVTTSNGTSFRVLETVGVDDNGDLALLKTEALPTSARSLIISKLSPRAGDRVIVIGNPLGLEGTVSDGIVSAFREVQGIGKLVQITAPISPGSSGSPVVNVWGEVIGVATLNLEGGQNLNFAISSERIVSLWPNLLTTSNVVRTDATSADRKSLSADEAFAKGVELYDGKYYEPALGLFQHSVKLNPNSVLAQHYLGLTFYALKRYRDAIAPFQAAINLDSNKNSIYNLARIYMALGDRNSALEQYTRLKNIDSSKAQELLSVLTNLSGYWKSNYGSYYEIVDDGDSVVIKNFYKENRETKFEAQRKGDIAFGYIIAPASSEVFRLVLKLADTNHIWFRRYDSYNVNLKTTPEKIFAKAQKESEKEPNEIWTRLP